MSRITRDDKVHKGRIPVSSSRAPLIYKGLDTKNYMHRWVLDKEDRIQRFLDGGYEFIKKTSQGTFVGEPTVDSTSGSDSRVKKATGTRFLYLMRIPKEFYEADQEAKAREIDELEETMLAPRQGRSGTADYGKITLTRKNLKEVLDQAEDV